MLPVEKFALVVGLAASMVLLSMIVWSIAAPTRRVWPPRRSTFLNRITVWFLTIVVFVSAFTLGVLGWNQLEWPVAIRWGLGVPLIVLGNLLVWAGVVQLGLDATGGEIGTLKSTGLYRFSRNPQYVADMGILLGWQLYSASYWAIPVVAAGVLTLLLAPIAEEPWLKANYGNDYDSYCSKTRRYL